MRPVVPACQNQEGSGRGQGGGGNLCQTASEPIEFLGQGRAWLVRRVAVSLALDYLDSKPIPGAREKIPFVFNGLQGFSF